MRRDSAALSPLRHWGRCAGRLARRGYWPFALTWCALVWVGLRWSNLWLCLLVLALLWPLAAASVRRLHDSDRTGSWLWLALIPGINLILVALLMAPPQQRPSIYDRDGHAPITAGLVGAVSAVMVLIALLASVASVPRAGMVPALMPGDLVLIWRRGGGGWANASCWPANCHTHAGSTPQRGELIAIRADGVAYGRAVAQAGDTVEIQAGILLLNGQPIPLRRLGTYQEPFGAQGPLRLLPRCANGAVGLGAICQKPAFEERLGDASYTVLDGGQTALDNYGPVTVPEGHVFVLADSRDAPEDSRVAATAGGLGFVAQSDIIGRPARVLISGRGASLWYLWRWRWDRIWERVS